MMDWVSTLTIPPIQRLSSQLFLKPISCRIHMREYVSSPRSFPMACLCGNDMASQGFGKGEISKSLSSSWWKRQGGFASIELQPPCIYLHGPSLRYWNDCNGVISGVAVSKMAEQCTPGANARFVRVDVDLNTVASSQTAQISTPVVNASLTSFCFRFV
jgi:hypothetical protein